MISSKCSSLHTKLKSGERHSDEESFVDESTKIITKGTGIPQFTLLMWGHKKKTAEANTKSIEVT